VTNEKLGSKRVHGCNNENARFQTPIIVKIVALMAELYRLTHVTIHLRFCGGDGFHIWRVAVDILNSEQPTIGCPETWRMGWELQILLNDQLTE
jgi:hypothetical protein